MLAATLQKITESGNTKIILATHSRHMFDALTYNDQSQIIWLRQGIKQEQNDRTNLSILLDLGALDSFELLQSGKGKIIFLTEDTKAPRLRMLLKANGLEDEDYFIQPFMKLPLRFIELLRRWPVQLDPGEYKRKCDCNHYHVGFQVFIRSFQPIFLLDMLKRRS